MRTLLIASSAGCIAQKHSTLVRTSSIPPCLSPPLLKLSECHPCQPWVSAGPGPVSVQQDPSPHLRGLSHTLRRGPWEPCSPVSRREWGRERRAACAPVSFLRRALVPHELHSLPLESSNFLIIFSFGLKLRLLPVTQRTWDSLMIFVLKFRYKQETGNLGFDLGQVA